MPDRTIRLLLAAILGVLVVIAGALIWRPAPAASPSPTPAVVVDPLCGGVAGCPTPRTAPPGFTTPRPTERHCTVADGPVPTPGPYPGPFWGFDLEHYEIVHGCVLSPADIPPRPIPTLDPCDLPATPYPTPATDPHGVGAYLDCESHTAPLPTFGPPRTPRATRRPTEAPGRVSLPPPVGATFGPPPTHVPLPSLEPPTPMPRLTPPPTFAIPTIPDLGP